MKKTGIVFLFLMILLSVSGVVYGEETASRELENLFTTIDLMDATITDLQKEMAAGHVTSAQLTQMYIDRIQAYDKQLGLNSIISINLAAIQDAEALDQERLAGKVRGPLHGIPIVVKSNIDIIGMPTSAGSLALAEMLPADDAFVVKKLKDAGAVILAQTNLSEFAYAASSSRSTLGGVTHNAYYPKNTPMGSSGGTAVAVTSNFAAAGIGTDTGGSIRYPASFANLYGIRPTKGLTSIGGVFPLSAPEDTTGPMARTAEDLALMLEIMAGTDPGDDFTVEANADKLVGSGYVQNLSADVLKGMRIGYLEHSFSNAFPENTNSETEAKNADFSKPAEITNVDFLFGRFGMDTIGNATVPKGDDSPAAKTRIVEPDEKIKSMLERTRENLLKAGAEFVDLSEYLPDDKILELYKIPDNTLEFGMNKFLHDKGDLAPYKTVKDIMRSGTGNYSNLDYLFEDVDKLADSFEQTVDPYSVMVGSFPRTPEWQTRLDTRSTVSQILKEHNIDAVMYLPFSDVALDENMSDYIGYLVINSYNQVFGPQWGFPDITIPMGFSVPIEDYPSELPLGLSIFSDFGNDETLLKIAYAYEQQAGKDIRRMPEITPALEDPSLNEFLQTLISKADSIDYTQYGKLSEQLVQQMLEACTGAQNVNTKDPYAVYAAAQALAGAYDAVMKELREESENPGRAGIPEFFRLEGELPATGITAGSGKLLSEKPASLNYRPLGMELQIPTLDLNSEIVALTPENGQYPIDWLGKQTGWLEGSALPGEGLSVLAAHNTLNAEEYGPFALIGTLQKGDRFSLLQKNGRLIMFEVYANEKVGSYDFRSLEEIAAEFENTLTLLTCEDESLEGGYASRRIVAARKLEN